MDVVITGMRRSGTTILYDCLYEDSQFDSLYEPFCYGKKNIGGGSGVRNISFSDKLNKARQRFISINKLNISPEFFNLGAPSDFKKEFEENIPAVFSDYLKSLASNSKFTLMKFVRLSHKIKAFHEIFQEIKFIHIVKDPRRAAMSHIFGRSKSNSTFINKRIESMRSFFKKKFFFNLKTEFNNWSSEDLINYFIESNSAYDLFATSPSYERPRRRCKRRRGRWPK